MIRVRLLLVSLIVMLVGCTSSPALKVVDDLKVDKFMGDWYVIAHIPIFVEAEAFNAVENYTLNSNGDVDVTFSFNKSAFDGAFKKYESKAFIDEANPGQWRIQFLWPFTADFRVAYVDDKYENTVIARKARDYVWIMSRSPDISEHEMLKMKKVVESLGYDLSKLRVVPHIQGAPKTSL